MQEALPVEQPWPAVEKILKSQKSVMMTIGEKKCSFCGDLPEHLNTNRLHLSR